MAETLETGPNVTALCEGREAIVRGLRALADHLEHADYDQIIFEAMPYLFRLFKVFAGEQ
jgi:hypothetical protein